jgi:hypothetical protein
MLTLGQVKNSSVANIAGVSVSDQQFTQLVNDAVRQLMELGNGGSRGWWGTVQAIQGIAYDGCFVWPANIIAVLGMKTRYGQIKVANHWYSFVPENNLHTEWARRWNGSPVVEFEGQTCLFQSVASSPTLIKVISNSAADSGSSITLYGTDQNGKTIAETVAIGSVSTNAFAFVSDVAKARTAGELRLYAYNGSTGLGALLAIYQGGDINPKFLYSRLTGMTCTTVPITALVKIGFSEVASDTDVIPLDNVDAIKSMVQAIKCREAGDNATGDQHEKNALRRLVNQVKSRFPLEQTTVSLAPFGTQQFNQVTTGMI